ncbi:error-prone DNA polymerase [Methylocaldum gracile]
MAELHCLSNYSFLRGASHPEELVETAARLGYTALALTDECSLGGVVKAHLEARRHGLKLIVGSEFRLEGSVRRSNRKRPGRERRPAPSPDDRLRLEDGLKLVLLATDREGYAQLSGLITAARMNAPKGHYRLDRLILERHPLDHCLALWLPGETPQPEQGVWLKERFSGRLWIGVELFLSGTDRERLNRLCRLGSDLGLPLVACNDVHMHSPERQPLQDTLTAIRLNRPLSELGYALFPNGERHLRPLSRLARLYPPELLAEAVRIAERCRFSLDELRYEYPAELVPEGHTPKSWLRHLTEEGVRRRWPDGAPDKVRRQIEHELSLIADLAYEPYFLTIQDIVRFAREQSILCQGRGSAANSAVCYCLGITEVDPGRLDLLFERFISRERNEPPDIDVDFEHERREEVIQYIYRKYGRQRAALAASVITYRTRSAVRDVAKALGFSREQIDHLAGAAHFLSGDGVDTERLQAAGFDPKNPKLRLLAGLVRQLRGFPRHLSQHTGGFVIAADALPRLVPVENAAMPERTVIQWDKDDLEALGLLKVDVLALGMLTAIRKALDYVSNWRGEALSLDRIPAEDPAVYAMLQRADSLGVFQVESRAQMAMLPRLKPENYYDLVIQVAIVRPGPIQGDMVHPYLARRSGREPVTYPGPDVKKVLERTLGVPIFQEQVMQIAMVAAGFSAGEADQLRRAMAAWHRRGGLEKFESRLIEGMRERGYSAEFAEQIYRQIQGFGEYGFPESHSASFALLVYVSAWLKCHHPAAFTCALLNSQPMGFYAPAQLVQDARRHGVDVRPVDVRYSDYDCTLEGSPPEPSALRLGLRLMKGLSRQGAEGIVAARLEKPFADAADLIARAKLDRRDSEALAAADALHGLAGHRHRAFWDMSAHERPTPLFGQPAFDEGEPLLRPPREGENIVADYASTGLTLRRHPLTLLRSRLAARRLLSAEELRALGHGCFARTAGLVICRQRPMTASGVIFLTLEDETGQTNVIVWPSLVQRQRHIVLQAELLAVHGTVQEEDDVLHLVAGRLEDLSHWLGNLSVPCRDFH